MRIAYLGASILLAWASLCAAQIPDISAVPYSHTPLDIFAKDVGPRYRGFDPAAIYPAVKSLIAGQRKSPFETTEEYQRRVVSRDDAEIAPGVPLSAQLSFLLNDPTTNKANTEVGFSYDADFHTLSVSIKPQHRTFLRGTPVAVLRAKFEARKLGDYTGENAYGATEEVHQFEDRDYGVSFEPNSWLDGAKIFIKMDQEEARRLYPSLGVLLIFRLSQPWTSEQGYHHTPTIGDPSDSDLQEEYLHITPDQVWIYDLASGRVLEKVDKNSLPVGQAAYERERLERFPVRLEISSQCESSVFIRYRVDDGPEESGQFAPGLQANIVQLPVTLEAKERIVISTDYGYTIAHLTFRLNGQVVQPEWKTDKGKLVHRNRRPSPAGPCYGAVPKNERTEAVFHEAQAK